MSDHAEIPPGVQPHAAVNAAWLVNAEALALPFSAVWVAVEMGKFPVVLFFRVESVTSQI